MWGRGFFFFKQKTVYEVRISDWSSDVCSSDLVYSPEREDPSKPDFTTNTIPKIIGGRTPACLDVGMALYGQVIDKLVPVSSTRAAELTKLLENIHRAVNIGLVNELKIVADKLDIRSEERRVGKEWCNTFRSRWSPYHSKKTK